MSSAVVTDQKPASSGNSAMRSVQWTGHSPRSSLEQLVRRTVEPQLALGDRRSMSLDIAVEPPPSGPPVDRLPRSRFEAAVGPTRSAGRPQRQPRRSADRSAADGPPGDRSRRPTRRLRGAEPLAGASGRRACAERAAPDARRRSGGAAGSAAPAAMRAQRPANVSMLRAGGLGAFPWRVRRGRRRCALARRRRAAAAANGAFSAGSAIVSSAPP